jgi:hypothetical protein
MALGQIRTNGFVASAQSDTTPLFNNAGYQPLLINVAGTGVATADTGGNGTAIVEGTRTRAVRAIATLGTVLATDSASATTAVTVLVDLASFNAGAGPTTSGAYGALKDAVSAATGVSVGSLTVTTSTGFTSAGVWTLA